MWEWREGRKYDVIGGWSPKKHAMDSCYTWATCCCPDLVYCQSLHIWAGFGDLTSKHSTADMLMSASKCTSPYIPCRVCPRLEYLLSDCSLWETHCHVVRCPHSSLWNEQVRGWGKHDTEMGSLILNRNLLNRNLYS